MSSPNQVFEAAYQRFLTSLSQDDKARFTSGASHEDLLAGLQKLETSSRNIQKQTFTKASAVIQDLNDRLKPYFAIIDSSVTQGSLYAGAALAALRLLLELAGRFPAFFQRLIKVIELLSKSFPQYVAIEAISQRSPAHRMVDHLGKVYEDLFLFFQSAAEVFSTSNGRIRGKAEMTAKIFWKPFDTRFAELLQRMDVHRQLVFDELQILQAEKTTDLDAELRRVAVISEAQQRTIADMNSLMSSRLKDKALNRIIKWLRAPDFSTVWMKSFQDCEQGTSEWIFEHPMFLAWKKGDVETSKEADSNRILWVYGHPGGGKTTLAASVVNHFSSQLPSTDIKHVLYFFFRYNQVEHSSPVSAYRSMLTQVLHLHRSTEALIDKFAFAITEGVQSTGQLIASDLETIDLLQLSLRTLDPTYIVLDGVDECDNVEELVKVLRLLTDVPGLRLLIFSRPNVRSLMRFVPNNQRLAFGQDAVSEDLKVYFTRNLNEMVAEDLLPPGVDLPTLRNRLVLGADKMFLWARLMVTYLHSPALTPLRREQMICSITLPEGLDAVYERIFNLIGQLDKAQQQLAHRILAWIVWSRRGMSLDELHEAICTSEDGKDSANNRFSNFSEVVSLVTCGLVTVASEQFRQPLPELTGCCLVHLSAYDYIVHWRPPSPQFLPRYLLYPARSTANMELVTICLRHFLSSAPATMPSKFDIRVARRGFIHRYGAIHWTAHLEHSIPETNEDLWDKDRFRSTARKLQETISEFLATPLAVANWVETFYHLPLLEPGHLITNMAPHLQQALRWTESIQQSTVPEEFANAIYPSLLIRLWKFCEDMRLFADQWESRLQKDPNLIWDDALVFRMTEFLPQSRGTHTNAYVPRSIASSGASSRSLCHISNSSKDGKVLGVLSIWPSARYEEFWHSLDPQSAYSQIELFCTSWTARYEMWSTDNAEQRLVHIIIPLATPEICLQMRQSFRQESQVRWKTSFPLAISEDGLSIVILRTLYQLRRSASVPHVTWKTAVLPLHLIPIDDFGPNWDDSIKVPDPTADHQDLTQDRQLFLPSWYSYSTMFGPDTRYLLFSDHRTPFRSHVILFEIVNGEPLAVRTVSMAKVWSSSLIEFPTFHPTMNLIGFYCDYAVHIWRFSGCANDATPRSPLNLLNISCPLKLKIYNPGEEEQISVTGLSFSSCGQFIIVTSRSVSDVIRLPQTDFWSEPDVRQSEIVSQHDSPAAASHDTPQDHSSSANECIIRSGQAGDHIFHQSNLALHVSPHGSVDMTARRVNAAVQQQINLLTLPEHAGATDVAVKVNDNGESRSMSVILNKKPEDGYDLLNSRPDLLPAVVQRPFHSLLETYTPGNMRFFDGSKTITSSNPLRLCGLKRLADVACEMTGDERRKSNRLDLYGKQ